MSARQDARSIVNSWGNLRIGFLTINSERIRPEKRRMSPQAPAAYPQLPHNVESVERPWPSFSASCLTSSNMRSSIGNVAGCKIANNSATKQYRLQSHLVSAGVVYMPLLCSDEIDRVLFINRPVVRFHPEPTFRRGQRACAGAIAASLDDLDEAPSACRPARLL